jgi:hypothetical protein
MFIMIGSMLVKVQIDFCSVCLSAVSLTFCYDHSFVNGMNSVHVHLVCINGLLKNCTC